MSTTTTPHTITPLSQLHPPSDPSTPTTTFVNLTVSLLWPYSSSSRLLRLVLSEKDPRLRAHKGQVHVTFRGASARALSGVEIGDEVLLGLQGAEWTEWKDGDGKRERDVDWKLEFTGRCWAQVTKTGSGAGSEEVMVVDVEEQEEEDQQEQKQHPESPDQQQDSVTVAAESSPEFISQDTYTLTTQEWKTPVSFNKRRAPDSPLLSASGTYFGNLFDDEEADLAALEEEELRPRKKPRFSQSSYRLISSDAPSPEGEKGRGEGWKELDEAKESGVSFFSSQTIAVEQEEDAEAVDAKGGETMQYTIPGIEVPNEDRMDLTADFDKPEMPPPPAPSQAPEPDEGVEDKSQPQQQQPQAPASPDLKPVDSWGLPLVSPLESKGVMFTDYMGTRPLGTQEATTEETPIQDQEATISRPQSTGGYVSDITENDSLFNSRPASPPEAARKLHLPRSPRPSPLRNVGQFESPKSQLWRRKEDVQQEEEIVAPLQLPRPQPVTEEEEKEEEKEEEREEQEEKPSPQPDPPSILDEQQEETEKEEGEYEKAEVEEEEVSEGEEEVEVEEGSYQSETEKDQDEETEVEYEEVGSDDVEAGSVEEAEVEEVDVEEEEADVEEVESLQEDWRELAGEEERERGESDVEEVEVEEEEEAEEEEAEEEVEVEVEEIEEETEEDEVEEVESGEEEEGEVEKVEAEVEEEGVEEIAEVEEVESSEEEEGEVEVVEAEVEEVEEYEVEEGEEEEVQEYEDRRGYNQNEYEEAEETEVDEVEVEEEETESEEEEEQHHQQETEKSEIPTQPTQPTQPPRPSLPTNDTTPPAKPKSPASITTDPPKAPSVSAFTNPLHAYFQPKPTPIPATDEEEEGEEEEREEQEEEKIQPSALVNHHHSTTITIPPQEMFKTSLKVPASNETLQSGKTVLLAASSEAAVTGSTTTITTTTLPPHPHISPSSTSPFQPGITTSHSDFPPLSTLHRRYNITADILSLICRSKPIERAKSGPRDHFVTFRVIDPSSFPSPPTTDPPNGLGNIGTTITLFRPHKPALPTPLNPGDVILLRDIKIVSQRGGVVGGVSCRTSAWAVWPHHYHHHHASPPEHPDGGGSGGGEGSETPSIVGPPVEFGREEVEYVRKLRVWWDGLGDGVRRELGVWPEETGKGKRKGKGR